MSETPLLNPGQQAPPANDSADQSQPTQNQPQSSAQPQSGPQAVAGQPAAQPSAVTGGIAENAQAAASKVNPAQPATTGSNDSANANHPLVKHASILHTIAQTLAGGPRYQTTIDVNTGERKQVPVPLSGKDIGMAIALSAIQGGLAGLGAKGPNATAEAAQRGFAATAGQREKMDEQQDQQAQADFARKASLAHTNMQMIQNALSISHARHDLHQADVDSYAPVYDALQKVGAVKDVVNEEDLPKYNVTKDGAIPIRVIPRMNADGTQATSQYGEPLWDKQYAIVDPNASIELPDDIKNLLVKYRIPGYVNAKGEPINLPKNLQMRAQMVVDGIEKANTVRFAQHAFDGYSEGKPHEGGSTGGSIWTLFTGADGRPDLDSLAEAISKHEGGNDGDRNVRNNNPGNLKDGQFAKSLAGYAGADENGFAKFKSADDGHSALVAMLRRDMNKYPDASPVQYINAVYSPDKDKGNGPGQAQAYADHLMELAGKDSHEAPDSPFPKVDLGQALAKGDINMKDLQVMQKAGGFQAFVDGKYGEPSTVDKMAEQGKLPGDSIGRIKALVGGDGAINQFKQQRDDHLSQLANDRKLDFEDRKKQQEERGIVTRNDKLIDAMVKGDKFDITRIATMRAYDREIIVNEALKRAEEQGIKWNPEDVQARINLYNDAADASKTGSFANSVSNANTSLGHMGGALSALDNLKAKHSDIFNDTNLANKTLSWFNDKLGTDPDWTRFKVNLNTAATDWQNLLNNQHALTDHDKDIASKVAEPTQPMANSLAAIQEMAHTAAVRIKPLNEKWKQTMGADYPNLIQPDTIKALQKINNPDVLEILGEMQSGGNLRGSSDGTGTPGKRVNDLLGNQSKWTPPTGLKDATTVKDGTVARDAQGNPVAIAKGGQWQRPQ
jgi:hypothetical protein